MFEINREMKEAHMSEQCRKDQESTGEGGERTTKQKRQICPISSSDLTAEQRGVVERKEKYEERTTGAGRRF